MDITELDRKIILFGNKFKAGTDLHRSLILALVVLLNEKNIEIDIDKLLEKAQEIHKESIKHGLID